jgi:hypothetical protein
MADTTSDIAAGDVAGALAIDPSKIAALRVYPPLGIARVGNAEDPADPFDDQYVFGPEVVGGWSTLPDGSEARLVTDFRNAGGAIKRQAARFRVYATLKDGSTQELTIANGVGIEWRVAIANLKAGWYEFNQAMDLGPGLAKDALKRNRSLPSIPMGRSALDITPVPRSISGASVFGPQYVFGDGTFWSKQVYLGELRTDSVGRLIFLGGHGRSASFRKGMSPITFANNDGWYDDTSDGPVGATVVFADGTKMDADPGYVAVTPPSYAPGLPGLVTMDDTVRETYIASGWLAAPTSTSFTGDVWPIFDRLSGLQWVDHGLFVIHGYGSPLCAREPHVVDQLRDSSTSNQPWRQRVFQLFRDPNAGGDFQEAKIPQIFGDAYGETGNAPNVYLSVTKTQFEHLRRWAGGHFVDDWTGAIPQPPKFEQLSPEDQIAHLERAPLHDCLGGPFHPGIELTWVTRLKSVWSSPYRLKILSLEAPAKQNFGASLSPAACLAADGPYDGIAAGALTRFLGVPWQTDSASCNSNADYSPSEFLSMPTYWGARMPDQVLSEASFTRILDIERIDKQGMRLQAIKHFSLRSDWLRDVRALDYYGRIKNMTEQWALLGMALPATTIPDGFPPDMRVEQGRDDRFAGSDLKRILVAAIEGLASSDASLQPSVAEDLAAGPARAQPPMRRYRQGEV